MSANETLPSELNALLDTISSAMRSSASTLPASIPATQNGLSLLDLKNALLLSYIQNIALLTLAKLDNTTFTLQTPEAQGIIWDLIEDRVHLEKGVFPLEAKMSYQIRKLLREAQPNTQTPKDENLRFKPDPSALISAAPAPEQAYKPPKISSTTLPTTRSEVGPRRNKVLEEFISSSSLSTAPTELPSIGNNVAGIGARNMYKTSRNDDIQRYEEDNFIRLPANIGKEKKKGLKRRGGMEGFGGEDWSGLDRIGKGGWDFAKGKSKIEKSRKREFDESGAGEIITGRAFEKRKKILSERKQKKHRGAKR